MVANGFDDDQTRSFTSLVAGTKISHYTIISKIGAGGMGEVYLAEDTKLKRKVALKFMPALMASDTNMRARFTREAQAVAKLDHPNIVHVHEVGEFNNRPFFAMAYIEGHSLKEVIKQGKLSSAEAVDYVKQICEGLHEAHSAGVVHRDVKPANIIIDKNNKPRILDFGLATVSGEEKLTKTGSTLGTVGYMAPEQITGKNVDHRADLFALGVILYEMITGRRPFDGDNDAAVIRAITDITPEPIARFKSGVTGELQQIVDKALMKDPSLRYQHADGMQADLKRLQVGAEPQKKRRLTPILMSSLIVIAIITALVLKPWKFEIQSSDEARAAGNMLAIMYFDNLADQSDSLRLGEITTNLLITDLSESEYLRVVSSQRLHDIMNLLGNKGEKRIDQDVATQVARTAKARWMLQGSILRTNPSLILTAQVVEVASGTALSSQRVEGEPGEDIFSLIDKLSSEIKNDLFLPDLPRSEQDRSISDITTHSVQAYRYYLEGVEYYSNYEYEKAGRSFKKALEYDSTFAMAYYGLSYKWIEEGNNQEMINKALQYSDKVSKLELLIIKSKEAYYLDEYNKYNKQIESLNNILKYDPYYKEAYLRLGFIYGTIQHNYAKAIGYYEKVIEIDPLYTKAFNELAYAYHGNGDKDKAIWTINKYIELAPNDANPYDSRAEIYGFNGQLDLAIESYKEALEINPEFLSRVTLGHMYIFKKEYEKADECYQWMASSGNKSNRSMARIHLAYSPLFQGKFEQAIEIMNDALAADKLQQYDRTWHLNKQKHKAFAHLELGDYDKTIELTRLQFDRSAAIASYLLVKCKATELADSLMASIKEYIEEEVPEDMDFYWRCKGFAHVAEGNGDSAMYYLEKVLDARDRGLHDYTLGYMLGYAYLLAEKLPQAIAEFEGVQHSYHSGAVSFPTWYVRGFYLLGQAYEKSNWNDKAIESYSEFIDFWKGAEPPVPDVEDARKRLAKLKASS